MQVAHSSFSSRSKMHRFPRTNRQRHSCDTQHTSIPTRKRAREDTKIRTVPCQSSSSCKHIVLAVFSLLQIYFSINTLHPCPTQQARFCFTSAPQADFGRVDVKQVEKAPSNFNDACPLQLVGWLLFFSNSYYLCGKT